MDLDLPAGVAWIVYLSILGGLVLYFMEADERARLLGWLLRQCRAAWLQVRTEGVRHWTRQPNADGPVPILPLATWSIVIINLGVFGGVLLGPGRFGDPATLLSWGASVGPRATNGEWWRLVTATFVHTGPFDMLVMLAGFVPVAMLTERLVGRLALCFVYLGAGTVANLICLFTSPVHIVAGSAAAILGVYGLLTATWTWGLLRRSHVEIPWRTARALAPGVGVFLLYVWATARVESAAAVAACAGGTIQGLMIATGARDHKPRFRRIALLAIDTAALVTVLAVPLRGMTDARPAVARVLEVDARTVAAYDAAVARFTSGKIRVAALARLIDEEIRPELQKAAADLLETARVPRDQQPLVAAADDYLRLCDESWRLRSEALRTGRTRLLKDAGEVAWRARDARARLENMNR